MGLLVCSLSACNSTEQKNTSKNDQKIAKDDLSLLKGYWISVDYFDSLLKNKSVAEADKAPLAMSALMLQIIQDTVVSYGTLFSGKKWKLNPNYEDLGLGWKSHKLSYNNKQKIIVARSIKDNTLTSLFRKIKDDESKLVQTKNGRSLFIDLQANVYAFIINKLIKGKYKPLLPNNPSSKMKLNANGTITGFKNYNKYQIHDYFGTSHPYRPEDAIIFRDTTIINSGKGPPTNIGIFSWEFKQDTLILTKMFTKDYYSYKEGTETYTFIKQGKQKKLK
ncbi:hypothetical protein BKI52_02845 [marine bacterium AO1-C]|nr:hypothetical protein BKI52_02845 [marine bacterium AO1-C]